MAEIPKTKRYDLEERCMNFARRTRDFTKLLPKSTSNYEYSKQLLRSSSSIGANYIEANESLSKKDFFMRIKISRKEAKETEYWLALVEPASTNSAERELLAQEALELRKIFGSIVEKEKIKSI